MYVNQSPFRKTTHQTKTMNNRKTTRMLFLIFVLVGSENSLGLWDCFRIVCFMWPAVFSFSLFYIISRVSFSPSVSSPLSSLGQSSVVFHHVRLQSWTTPGTKQKKKKKDKLFSCWSSFSNYFSSGCMFLSKWKKKITIRKEHFKTCSLCSWSHEKDLP